MFFRVFPISRLIFLGIRINDTNFPRNSWKKFPNENTRTWNGAKGEEIGAVYTEVSPKL
jgi:hypothetical protein